MRFFARLIRLFHTVLRSWWSDRQTRVMLIFLPTLIIVAALVPHARGISEDVMFAIDPTAERGLRYGSLHMSSNSPHLYDIQRAQKYLEAAREIDPTYPVVNYQLARIYFIQRHPILSLMSTNAEIRNATSTPMPEVYYMKGLIEGSIGQYDTAAADYRTFLDQVIGAKNGWAAYNDYAWVLLKGGRAEDALAATLEGLEKYPNNAWLLTMKTSTLYELGRFEEAVSVGEAAVTAADMLTESQWRSAYPGNDPRTTENGLNTIRRSARDNLEKVKAALTPVR